MTTDLETQRAVAAARVQDARLALDRATTNLQTWSQTLSEIDHQLAASRYPDECPYRIFLVGVRPDLGSAVYEYVVMNVGGRFFTTGRKQHNYFSSWEKLVDWLRSNHWHSHLEELVEGERSWVAS